MVVVGVVVVAVIIIISVLGGNGLNGQQRGTVTADEGHGAELGRPSFSSVVVLDIVDIVEVDRPHLYAVAFGSTPQPAARAFAPTQHAAVGRRRHRERVSAGNVTAAPPQH